MSEHTPGPWHVAESGRAAVVLDEDIRIVAKTWPHVRDGNDPAEVAEAAANARLIAAAPDLLAALKQLASEAGTVFADDHFHADNPMVNMALAAIAKAEGLPRPRLPSRESD